MEHNKHRCVRGMDDVRSVILLLCDVLLALVLLTGSAANATALLVFCRRPGLRTLPNRFVVNLLCTNLVVTCAFVPLVLIEALTEFQSILYAVSEGMAAGVCSASVLAVLLIALDQYCAVVDPLRYHSRISKGRSAGLMVATWTLSCLMGVLHGFDLYPQIFAAVYSTIVFLLPFCAILWMYVCIYTAAHKNSKRTRIAEAERTPSMRSTNSSLVSSLKYRISNASMFRYREETRAARISALVIVMALVCWLPYVAVLMLRPSLYLPGYVQRVALTLLASGALVSPCLFAYRNKRIQRESRKLLGCPVHDRERRCRFPQRKVSLLGKTEFVAIPETALVVDTCRSSFSSGGSTQGTSSSLETD
ncbi:hypothetical protein C0J52_20658 [Blattella germanica]|nr:hypothetical protein C0J52_20658 [Blattella germanica]